MDIQSAKTLGRALMASHGLEGWTLAFDGAKARAGQCRYAKKEISLSAHYVTMNDETLVRNTILHEIAHAKAGSRAGHGRLWRATALAIGCTAARCYDATKVKMPEHAFLGTCPNCKRTVKRHKRNRIACSDCCVAHNGGRFDPRFLFTFTRI